MNFKKLFHALQGSWDAQSSYSREDCTAANPALGQCAVSSLIVQDYLGGEIIRFESTSGDHTEKHYANLISGALVDTTRSQFTADTSLKESPPDLHGFKNLRERMLSDASTAERYKYLKSKVEQILAA